MKTYTYIYKVVYCAEHQWDIPELELAFFSTKRKAEKYCEQYFKEHEEEIQYMCIAPVQNWEEVMYIESIEVDKANNEYPWAEEYLDWLSRA